MSAVELAGFNNIGAASVRITPDQTDLGIGAALDLFAEGTG